MRTLPRTRFQARQMAWLTQISTWITANESLLSGLAALIVVVGVVASLLGIGLRCLMGRASNSADKPSASRNRAGISETPTDGEAATPQLSVSARNSTSPRKGNHPMCARSGGRWPCVTCWRAACAWMLLSTAINGGASDPIATITEGIEQLCIARDLNTSDALSPF